jgi:hypothetical protein
MDIFSLFFSLGFLIIEQPMTLIAFYVMCSSADHLSTVGSKQVKVQSNHSRKLGSKLCHVLKNNNDK